MGYIGCSTTKEMHRDGCPYLARVGSSHRVSIGSIGEGQGRGYDCCYWCLGGGMKRFPKQCESER